MMNIKATAIAKLLEKTSVTFAGLAYTTTVPTAARYKGDVTITKSTTANVQLFGTITTCAYQDAVKRCAIKNGGDATNFVPADTYFKHTDCYSLVEHKQNGKMYLHAIYNSAKSTYYINGIAADKSAVAMYLTPAAADALLHKDATVRQQQVITRTIALENITRITANKQTLTF